MGNFDLYLKKAKVVNNKKSILDDEDALILKADQFISETLEEGDEDFIAPTYEPEDCEYCLENEEEDGIEYERNFSPDGQGGWICDNCGNPV